MLHRSGQQHQDVSTLVTIAHNSGAVKDPWGAGQVPRNPPCGLQGRSRYPTLRAWQRRARLGRGINRAFGRANDPVALIAAIAELVAGVIVLAGVFFSVRTRLPYAATLGIAILWAVRILFGFFARDVFEPDFVIWANPLAADLIILLAVWPINRKCG